MKVFNHNNLDLIVFDNGRFTVSPHQNTSVVEDRSGNVPNFEINVCGTGKLAKLGTDIVFKNLTQDQNGITLVYIYRNIIEVSVKLTFTEGADVILQQNTAKNISDKVQKLTRFSSCHLSEVCLSDEPYYENDSIRLYVCNNKWQGEGQWQSFTPEQLGLFPATTHPWEHEVYRIQSLGSWSTGNFYPMTVAVDGKNGFSWFMETECSNSWMIRYTSLGGYTNPVLQLDSTCADEGLGWTYDLAVGEEYTSEKTFFGVTPGGFENAVQQLLTFKRADSTASYDSLIPPVIFNVYMDCIWGNPHPDKLLPLIDAASKAGAEIFVIDGGWQKNANGIGCGDWLPGDKYKDMPLEKILEYIKSKGMKPGIWTELETVFKTADGFDIDEDAVLKRYDRAFGDGKYFYNFCNKKVCNYLKSRIDYLYSIGVRYIKNDYNHSVGLGPDNNNAHSPAEGTKQNTDAFLAFIEDIRATYPDLIVENCGSGALRSDNKTLRHFYVQSTSDQELYRNNASILVGSMTQMPPEKCGMWSYPYPIAFEVKDTFEIDDEYKALRTDGRETAFNMITAMSGTMFLSGRIDCCDKYNFSLVKDAVSLYKGYRNMICKSKPIFPTGLCPINKSGLYSFGIISENKLILTVWSIRSKNSSFKVDLSSYISKAEIKNSYFADNTVSYKLCGTELNVEFNGTDCAALFEIDI